MIYSRGLTGEKKFARTFRQKVIQNSSKKTLWIVSELYYPEETSTGYYLTRIAEGLTESFAVKVLCGQPNYFGRGIRAPKEETHKSVKIFRVFGTTLDKNAIVYRLINMLTLSVSILRKAMMNFQKGDKILVVTTPPSLPFMTAFAALFRGGSYILLIHDNYPEILIAAGKVKKNSFAVKFLNFLNQWLYKYACKIIVVGRDMRELVERKTEGLNIPVIYIPNWAELERVKPKPRQENELLKELRLAEKFVFLYAGNMGYPNDLESIVSCAEKLKANENFHFIFLGEGVKRKWLEREIKEKKLNNATLLASRPRAEQNIFLNACDVALVSLVKNMRGVSMPSRTYNILAVGKPILALAEEDSEIAKVIEEESVGWVVPPCEPEILLQTILRIFQEREKIEEMSGRAIEAAAKKYSSEKALKKYESAIMQCV